MRRLLIVVAALVGVCVLLLALAPVVANTEFARSRVLAALSDAVGRPVTAERLEVGLYPDIRVEAAGLAVAGDAPDAPLLRVRAAAFDMPIWPLLAGVVDLRRLTVDGVEANVDLAGLPRSAAGDDADGRGPDRGDGGGADREPGGGLADLRIGVLRVADVDAVVADSRTGRTVRIEDGRLEGALPDLDSPATVQGRATVNGRPISLDGRIADPRALSDGRPTEATLTADAGGLARLEAVVRPTGGDAATGRIELTVPDVPAAARWLDAPRAGAAPVRAVAFRGDVAVGGGRVEMRPFSLSLDDARIEGAIAVDASGARPRIAGEATATGLDLDRLGAAASPAGPRPAGAPSGERRPARTGGPPPSPSDRIPWESLREADVDLALRLEDVVAGGERIGPVVARVRLEDGALDARVEEARLLGGRVAGRVRADAGTRRLEAEADLDGLRLAPVLAATSELRAEALGVSGRLAAAGSGATRGEMARSLAGEAGLRIQARGLRPPPGAGTPPIEALALELSLPGFDREGRLSGTVTVAGRATEVEAAVANPRALAAGTTTPVRLRVEGPLVSAAFEGEAAAGGRAVGRAALSVPSVTDLASAMGAALADPPVRSIRAEAQVDASPGRIALTSLDLRPDRGSVTGSVEVEAGPVPRIEARLTTEGVAVAPPPPGAARGGGPGGAGTPAPAGAGWSEEPFDLAALRGVEIDAVVENRGFQAGGVEIGPHTLDLDLAGGVLTAEAPGVPAFGGTTDVSLRLDATGEAAALALRAESRGVQAEPLLRALAGTEILRGTTRASVDATATGRSQAELVRSLDGTAAFDFRDGALRGINIAALLRDPIGAATGRAAEGPQETDFAELAAGFAIADGIARTEDLRMLAPLFRLQGAGAVDLPERSLDLLVTPTAVGTLEGQGGELARQGITIPVRIHGPWTDPRFDPDVRAALEAQGPAALDRIRRGEQPIDVLRGMLGGGSAPAAGGPAPQTEPAPPGETQAAPAPEAAPAPASPQDAIREGLRGLLGR
jgi:AsmA protein